MTPFVTRFIGRGRLRCYWLYASEMDVSVAILLFLHFFLDCRAAKNRWSDTRCGMRSALAWLALGWPLLY